MKKIISILCVMAMVLSFAAFSVNAADNEITLSLKSQDAESTVLALTMNSTYNVGSYQIYIDAASAIAAGATVSAEIVNGTKATYNAAQKMVLVTYSPTDGSSIPAGEGIELATITLSAVDGSYTVTRKADSTRTKYEIKSKEDDGSMALRTSEFPLTVDVTVNPFSTGETVNTIAVSDSVAVTTDAAATDCQIGTGIGLTANAGEAVFTKMIWALTSGENKLFSKVIELPGISGEFKVAATFINGSHNEKFDVEVVESVAIDAVNAIFTDGTADYFTDATDAALKAE